MFGLGHGVLDRETDGWLGRGGFDTSPDGQRGLGRRLERYGVGEGHSVGLGGAEEGLGGLLRKN